MAKFNLGTLIVKLYGWYMRRAMKKQKDTREQKQEKQRSKIYDELEQLYGFVRWLNQPNVLGNRKVRKIFWRKVADGEPVLEGIIEDLIKKYEKRPKNDTKLVVGKSDIRTRH